MSSTFDTHSKRRHYPAMDNQNMERTCQHVRNRHLFTIAYKNVNMCNCLTSDRFRTVKIVITTSSNAPVRFLLFAHGHLCVVQNYIIQTSMYKWVKVFFF